LSRFAYKDQRVSTKSLVVLSILLVACDGSSPTPDAMAGTDSGPRPGRDSGPDSGPRDAFVPGCPIYETSAPPPASLPACVPSLPFEPREVVMDTLDAGVRRYRNISYAQRGGFVLEGDLYVPVPRGETPSGILVIVHGGGWMDCSNRREQMSLYAELVTRTLGIATFNIEYRLSQDGGGFPENLGDVKCAVQWARSHAAEYSLDTRIGILGSSAGGHLALMTGLTSGRDDLDPACTDEPATVDIVLSYAGPTDLPILASSDSPARESPRLYTGETCVDRVRGQCLEERPCSRCLDASPLAHACHAGTVPYLLMHSPDPYDPLVPDAQSRALADAIEAAGGDVTLLIPTDEEMRASGCTPEAGSHALDGCMINATGEATNNALYLTIGPR
jgi:acetyl esterase/lipase